MIDHWGRGDDSVRVARNTCHKIRATWRPNYPTTGTNTPTCGISGQSSKTVHNRAPVCTCYE